MPRQKEPIDLLVLKGKSHLGKDEIERRKSEEIKAPSDKVTPPAYLSKEQKREFKKIARQLLDIGIMSNLDCDALARFIIAQADYIKFSSLLNSIEAIPMNLENLKDASSLKDRAFRQCRASAGDLGLTITSRCRLMIPKTEERKKNRFDRFCDTG